MLSGHRVLDREGQAEGSVKDPDDEDPSKQSTANSAGSERAAGPSDDKGTVYEQ
jgi:hypothetical protein